MPSKQYNSPPAMQIETNRTYSAVIKTNKGDIHLQLNPAEAPMTVNNFVVLARDGFYDGVVFHRVEPRFVIQGGDPTGTGRGGPGYKFKDEPVKRPYKAGTLAMANAGPNTNGSQFFICLEDQPGLPPSYTIFGDTISGMDVVRSIRPGDVMQSVTIE
ncbi:MAG TPA: peptidylprolyl isomerase [Ktedonobacteraceae bacterium]|nr:peptidylprolyl isomerase [Ktedonobacteraceae bacterium]